MNTEELDLSTTIYGQALEALHDSIQAPLAEKVYLGIDKNTETGSHVNDYRYVSDAIPKKPFFPVAYGKYVSSCAE